MTIDVYLTGYVVALERPRVTVQAETETYKLEAVNEQIYMAACNAHIASALLACRVIGNTLIECSYRRLR